ncbi:hypothetical protein B0J13DRAFT_455123 [Dactylonectria estremocensis]|uniref:Uncharacterized protein n=1 Tax=Dactylonectria estremocensis TaxID=1079267 RepID=A0A9P9DS88_9HYPO|nr:hypothetical protein B0J13DRAFT_455123 [Dactylonectria estremocensis]
MKPYFTLLAFGLVAGVSAGPQKRNSTVVPEDVQCDATYINDAEHPDLRWEAAGAEWAFKVATSKWMLDQMSPTPSTLTFTEFIGNLFNSKDLLICANMGDGPCQDTMTCDDVNQPAGNTYAFAQESANAAIGLGFTWAKTHLPTYANASEIQNNLSNAMGNLFEVWIESELEFLRTLFSGSSESVLTLEGLVNKGLALEITRSLDLGDFVNVAQKIMYAKLLPLAWKTSSVVIDDLPNGPMHPMILMVPDDCVTSGEGVWYIDEDKADQMAVCHDGHTFFLGFPTWRGVPKSDHISRLVVWALPGGEHNILNGENWGGLTLDDIVISSYEGYRLNGYKNGYTIPENSQIIDGTGSQGSLIMENGVRTPGFMSLPICTPGKLERVSSKWNANVINHHAITDLLEQIPCGDGALTEVEMAAFGFS